MNIKWTSSIIEVLKQQNLYNAEEVKRRKMVDIANKQASSRIIQYNEKAEPIAIFNSAKEAELKTKINAKNIRTAVDIGSGAGGYLWGREGEAPPKARKIKTGKVRKVEQIDLQTNEVIAIYNNVS